jgi:hypothetical protein
MFLISLFDLLIGFENRYSSGFFRTRLGRRASLTWFAMNSSTAIILVCQSDDLALLVLCPAIWFLRKRKQNSKENVHCAYFIKRKSVMYHCSQWRLHKEETKRTEGKETKTRTKERLNSETRGELTKEISHGWRRPRTLALEQSKVSSCDPL